MNLVVCEDKISASRAASKWCADRKPKSMFLPAGNTPLPLYHLWEVERPAFLEKCQFVQIDDVLTGRGRGQFRAFFEKELPSAVPRFHWIDRADEGAEIALLGLGLNGHIAFHEPGLGDEFYSGCVKLSATTCNALGSEQGTWGVTYGAGAFHACRAIAILVTGASKKEVLAKLLNRDRTLPASGLLAHADITVIADRDAYGAST